MPESDEKVFKCIGYIVADGDRITSVDPTEVKGVYRDGMNTTVRWGDGSVTTVHCSEEDVYDPLLGFLLCVAKRHFGGTGRYLEVMREHGIPEQPRPSKIEINCGRSENLSVEVYTAAWNEPAEK